VISLLPPWTVVALRSGLITFFYEDPVDQQALPCLIEGHHALPTHQSSAKILAAGGHLRLCIKLQRRFKANSVGVSVSRGMLGHRLATNLSEHSLLEIFDLELEVQHVPFFHLLFFDGVTLAICQLHPQVVESTAS
jgi:hypothetical protein